MQNRLSSRPARLGIIVLTLWALLLIVPDVTRPFWPLGTIGLGADNNGRITSVEAGGPAAEAGVIAAHLDRPGDVIDLHTTSRDDLVNVFAGRGGIQYLPIGRTVELHLIAPDGRSRIVALTAREAPLAVAAALVLELDQLLGIGFVLLAAFLVWVHPRRTTLGFFLFAIWFNPGQYSTFLAYLPRNLMAGQEALQAIFEAAGIVGFLIFALRFPNDRVENWRASVERGSPLLFVVLATLSLLSFGPVFGRPSEVITRAAYGAAFLVYPLVVFAFITKLRVLSPADALRLRWSIAGCIPGLFFYIIADSIQSTSVWQRLWDTINWQPPETLLNLAYMVNALVAIGVGYAVVRQRVLPVAFLINRGLVLGIVWATVTMTVEAILILSHRFLEYSYELSSLVTALVIVAVAPLLEVFKERISHFVDRLFFRRFHEIAAHLAGVGERFMRAPSVDAIDAQLIEEPADAYDLASAALFRLRDDGAFALAPNARGWPAGAARVLAADDPIVRHFRTSPKPDRLRDLFKRRDFPSDAGAPAVIIPLTVDRTVEGLLMYGGHETGTDLSPDEIAILADLAAAAAGAREHVRYVSLSRRLEAGISERAGG